MLEAGQVTLSLLALEPHQAAEISLSTRVSGHVRSDRSPAPSAGVIFIDENDEGPGVRLRKRRD